MLMLGRSTQCPGIPERESGCLVCAGIVGGRRVGQVYCGGKLVRHFEFELALTSVTWIAESGDGAVERGDKALECEEGGSGGDEEDMRSL